MNRPVNSVETDEQGISLVSVTLGKGMRALDSDTNAMLHYRRIMWVGSSTLRHIEVELSRCERLLLL